MRIGKILVRVLRRGVGALIIPSILASLLDACVLAGLRIFLAIAHDSKIQQWIPISSEYLSLWNWGGAMLVLVSIRLIILIWKQRILEKTTRYLEAFLQIWMHRITKKITPSFFHNANGLDNLRSNFEGCRTIVFSIDAGAQAMQAILQLIVFLPVLFFISWPLTFALLLGMLPILSWLQRYLRRLGKGMDVRLQDQGRLEALQSVSLDLLQNWTIERERNILSRKISHLVRQLWNESSELGQRKSLLVFVSDTIAAIAVIGVLGFCGWWMRSGGMSGTDLILYAAALILCYKPVKDCLRVVPSIREAMLAKERLQIFEQNVCKRSSIPSQNSESIQVEIKDFSFSFKGKNVVQVFNSLNLDVPTSIPVWLRGPNGSGKTTLLRCMAGLEIADRGSIKWPKELASIQKGFLSHRGVVPLVECFDWDRVDSHSRQELVSILGFSKEKLRDGLSAGQRQKLGIAWLFCSDVKILFLDEPFSFIAQKDRIPVLNAMLACAKEHNIWFVMASHDPFPLEWENQFHNIFLEKK